MTATWQWKLLRAGSFRLDGGSMFGILPKVLWSKLTEPDDHNRIHLQTNCVLLDNGEGQRVLIETGYGNKFDAKNKSIFALEDRWVGDALMEARVDPADINAVIVTHLHFDHAGGLTYHAEGDAEGTARPSFPNARIFVQRTEWDDALANKSTMTRTYLREQLDPVSDQVDLIDGESEVMPGIRVLPVPGHTWGQQAVVFEDEHGTLVFPGDVMPTRHHANLAANMAYDMLPYENSRTKRDLFDRCVAEHWRWIIDHEPGESVCRIAANSGRAGSYDLVDV